MKPMVAPLPVTHTVRRSDFDEKRRYTGQNLERVEGSLSFEPGLGVVQIHSPIAAVGSILVAAGTSISTIRGAGTPNWEAFPVSAGHDFIVEGDGGIESGKLDVGNRLEAGGVVSLGREGHITVGETARILNGGVHASSGIKVGGNLISDGGAETRGDLTVGGSLLVSENILTGRDLAVGERAQAKGHIRCGGKAQAGKNMIAGEDIHVAGVLTTPEASAGTAVTTPSLTAGAAISKRLVCTRLVGERKGGTLIEMPEAERSNPPRRYTCREDLITPPAKSASRAYAMDALDAIRTREFVGK
jgi:hypothetical protein